MVPFDKQGFFWAAEPAKDRAKETSRNKGHIAGEEQHGFGPSRRQCGIDSAKRAARWNPIVPDHPRRQTAFPGGGADPPQQRTASQTEPGLVPSHS